jgi:hypothetical protein
MGKLPLFIVLAFAPVAAHAFSCAILSRGPAQVTQAGVERTAPVRLADCEGVRVLAREVTVCYLDRGGRRECRSFRAGSTISASALGSRASRFGLLAAAWDMLRGDPDTAPAVVRAGGLAGMPSGDVAGLDARIVFDFVRAGSGKVERFALLEGGLDSGAVAVKREGTRASVPTSRLRRGAQYVWTATIDGKEHFDRFRLLSEDEVHRLRGELRSAEAGGRGVLARAALRAEVLRSAGLRYEADETLRRAGVELAD